MTINNQLLKYSTGVRTIFEYFFSFLNYTSCTFVNVSKTESTHFQVCRNCLMPIGNGRDQKIKKLPDIVCIGLFNVVNIVF